MTTSTCRHGLRARNDYKIIFVWIDDAGLFRGVKSAEVPLAATGI